MMLDFDIMGYISIGTALVVIPSAYLFYNRFIKVKRKDTSPLESIKSKSEYHISEPKNEDELADIKNTFEKLKDIESNAKNRAKPKLRRGGFFFCFFLILFRKIKLKSLSADKRNKVFLTFLEKFNLSEFHFSHASLLHKNFSSLSRINFIGYETHLFFVDFLIPHIFKFSPDESQLIKSKHFKVHFSHIEELLTDENPPSYLKNYRRHLITLDNEGFIKKIVMDYEKNVVTYRISDELLALE